MYDVNNSNNEDNEVIITNMFFVYVLGPYELASATDVLGSWRVLPVMAHLSDVDSGRRFGRERLVAIGEQDDIVHP